MEHSEESLLGPRPGVAIAVVATGLFVELALVVAVGWAV